MSPNHFRFLIFFEFNMTASLPNSFLMRSAASCIEAAVNFFIFIKYPPLQCFVPQHSPQVRYKKVPEDQGSIVPEAVSHTF
ncbi:hypothetical protein BN2127_JRS1_09240 [Bacillus cereus]|nr:hypothetical protein BN2127_JRS1_09240 [Bacillus cereus]